MSAARYRFCRASSLRLTSNLTFFSSATRFFSFLRSILASLFTLAASYTRKVHNKPNYILGVLRSQSRVPVPRHRVGIGRE